MDVGFQICKVKNDLPVILLTCSLNFFWRFLKSCQPFVHFPKIRQLSYSVYIRFVLFLAIGFTISGCQTDAAQNSGAFFRLEGQTMGTTYHVAYSDSLKRNFQNDIDQLLIDVNLDVSTYIDTSYISKFNRAEDEIFYLNIREKNAEPDPVHFRKNYETAYEIFMKSNGFFDPTIMPLVNYWGFGYTEKKAVEEVDSIRVDSLLQFVGMDKITKRSAKDGSVYLVKSAPGIQLDFSALAKGYGVDVVCELLEQNGIENFMVEIGGEVRAKGKNQRNDWWTVGINTPDINAKTSDVFSKVILQNRALATSGNYRNYYNVNGNIYAHTINPKTGFPEKSHLLSASVFAADCMTADAYATACMALGLEKAFELVSRSEDLDGFFIFSEPDGSLMYMHTKGMEDILVE